MSWNFFKNEKPLAIAGFALVFAVAIAWVFWGAWSPDFSIVSPDDPEGFELTFGQCLANLWNGFAADGRFYPTQPLWDGVIAPLCYVRELRYASGILLAAIAVVWFLRGRGLSRPAACAGGLFLAFSGYWITLFSAGHGGIFVWMSYGLFAFGLIDRAIASGKLRYWLLLGVTEGWATYRQVDLWLLFAFFAGLWYLFCAFRKGFSKQLVIGTIAAAITFALVGAPGIRDAFGSALTSRDQQIKEGQTISTAKIGEVDEAEKRWIFCTNWSLPPAEVAEFFIPRLNGDTSCPLTLSIGSARGTGVKPYTGAIGRPIDAKEGNYRQHSIYLGWVTCLFALFALLSPTPTPHSHSSPTPTPTSHSHLSPDVLFFAGAAIFFCLCSFGRYFEPLYRVIFALPFGDYLRAPVKWHHLTEFSVAVLAGFGVEAALKRFGSRKAVFAAILALVVFGIGDLAYHAHFYCAAIDIREARKTHSVRQTTVLRREDFSRPEVKQMVRDKRIISQAYYLGNPGLYLVDILKPSKPAAPKFNSPVAVPFALGILSWLAALAAIGYAVVERRKERSAG